MKRSALIFLIVTLLFTNFTQYVYAASDRDHDALMEYNGYGQAMYESIVEQTTYLTGQYTDNKEYVRESINQIKDYASFWANERDNWQDACGGLNLFSMSCLGDTVERAGGYFLTVGDWIKNLFTDYTDEYYSEVEENLYSGYITYSDGNWKVNPGYEMIIKQPAIDKEHNITSRYGSFTAGLVGSWGGNFVPGNENVNATIRMKIGPMESQVKKTLTGTDAYEHYVWSSKGNFGNIISKAAEFGVIVTFVEIESGTTLNPKPTPRPERDIKNYITNNNPQVVVPNLKPELVCPNGTRISMNISGSTFLAVDGTVMMVNKDGTAEVNGEICNLNWLKPSVDYNSDGQVVLTDPDGTKTNLETGDTTSKIPGSTDLEGCTGVICGIGKLLDGVGSIVKAITDLVGKLLDGILALFVPEDLDFISEEFSRITENLNKKIAITETLKEAITGVFDGGGGNPLADISINLPITNQPLTFGNVAFIEEGVPILRKVISAIVGLYTIAYVYRKITGRGGVMEK